MLRRSGKPVRLVVNKVDSHQKYMMDVYEFYNLGIGEPIPISAANRQGLGDMLDEVIKEFPDKSEEEDQDDIPKIAIVGKPNVGKSSLINKLLGEERVIVSILQEPHVMLLTQRLPGTKKIIFLSILQDFDARVR